MLCKFLGDPPLQMKYKNTIDLVVKFVFINFYYQIDKFVIQMARRHDKQEKKLLDIGAGNSPYKKYFRNIQYSTQDIRQNKDNTIDVIGDINAGLPIVPDFSFDFILCTQVLEHLKEPKKAIAIFYRILRPGGRVFLTTNFFYQNHMAPHDYYRFTKYGLAYLGESCGFIVEHIKPQGGIFHVLSYILTTMSIRLFLKGHAKSYYLYLLLFSPLIALLNLIAYALDFLDKEKEITINYEIIYRKPR